MSRAYRLYDQGANARLEGNNPEAVSKLNEAWKLFKDARDYQRTGESSLLEALVHFELALAEEAQGDMLSARDSYARCLTIRPTFVDASINLVNILAKTGQWQLALARADDAVRANPQDPRAHLLLALALKKTGHGNEAQSENQKARELFKAVPHYKPYGIDNALKKMQGESVVPGQEQPAGGNMNIEGAPGVVPELKIDDNKKKEGGDLSNVMGDDDSDAERDDAPVPPEDKKNR